MPSQRIRKFNYASVITACGSYSQAVSLDTAFRHWFIRYALLSILIGQYGIRICVLNGMTLSGIIGLVMATMSTLFAVHSFLIANKLNLIIITYDNSLFFSIQYWRFVAFFRVIPFATIRAIGVHATIPENELILILHLANQDQIILDTSLEATRLHQIRRAIASGVGLPDSDCCELATPPTA